MHKNNLNAQFLIKPTSAIVKNHLVNWYGANEQNSVKLIVKYIKKRKTPPKPISNLQLLVENSKIKLTWNNPSDKDFVGAYVVRNRFHIPKSPFDGTKLYAGKDNYTYDDFGNINIKKYYAIFTYDDVPNYSKPVIIEYKE
jgi:hypothetical protein